MKYQFQYQMTAFEIWKLSMYHMYHSIAGICNIIFTAAVILLTIKFRSHDNLMVLALLLLGCIWFPIVQPVIVYQKAGRQAADIPENMELGFDDSGIHVKTPKEVSHLKWNQVRGITKNYHMTVIHTGNRHGYMLSDRMLGEQKESFFEFLNVKLKSVL